MPAIQNRPPGGRVRPGLMAVDVYGRLAVVVNYDPSARYFELRFFSNPSAESRYVYPSSWGLRRSAQNRRYHGNVAQRRYLHRNALAGWVVPDAS